MVKVSEEEGVSTSLGFYSAFVIKTLRQIPEQCVISQIRMRVACSRKRVSDSVLLRKEVVGAQQSSSSSN